MYYMEINLAISYVALFSHMTAHAHNIMQLSVKQVIATHAGFPVYITTQKSDTAPLYMCLYEQNKMLALMFATFMNSFFKQHY